MPWRLNPDVKDVYQVYASLDNFLAVELENLDRAIVNSANIEVAIYHCCQYMINYQCSSIWGNSWSASYENILFAITIIQKRMVDYYCFKDDKLFAHILESAHCPKTSKSNRYRFDPCRAFLGRQKGLPIH